MFDICPFYPQKSAKRIFKTLMKHSIKSLMFKLFTISGNITKCPSNELVARHRLEMMATFATIWQCFTFCSRQVSAETQHSFTLSADVRKDERYKQPCHLKKFHKTIIFDFQKTLVKRYHPNIIDVLYQSSNSILVIMEQ